MTPMTAGEMLAWARANKVPLPDGAGPEDVAIACNRFRVREKSPGRFQLFGFTPRFARLPDAAVGAREANAA